MSIKIEEHALKQYVKRVLDQDPDDVASEIFRTAYLEIYLAVIDPDWIYHEKKNMAPVHVRGGIAVPVGTREEVDDSKKLGEGRVVPYSSMKDDLTVPTVYEASVFERKRDEETNTAPA